jgi:deoxyribonuclease V
VIIIDGYVWLGAQRPGLGAHLYESLQRRAAVIGVAKTRFVRAEPARMVLRGRSRSPLYVTAAGMDLAEAASHIRAMHGPYRIPTLLKRADQLSRGLACGELG